MHGEVSAKRVRPLTLVCRSKEVIMESRSKGAARPSTSLGIRSTHKSAGVLREGTGFMRTNSRTNSRVQQHVYMLSIESEMYDTPSHRDIYLDSSMDSYSATTLARRSPVDMTQWPNVPTSPLEFFFSQSPSPLRKVLVPSVPACLHSSYGSAGASALESNWRVRGNEETRRRERPSTSLRRAKE